MLLCRYCEAWLETLRLIRSIFTWFRHCERSQLHTGSHSQNIWRWCRSPNPSCRLALIWNVTLQFLLVIVFGMPMIKGLHARCHIGRAGDYAWESTVSLHTCRSHCTTAETSHHWEKTTFPQYLPNAHCIWATHCMYHVLGRILPKYWKELTMKMRCGSNTFILILAKLFTSHPSSSPSTNIRQM